MSRLDRSLPLDSVISLLHLPSKRNCDCCASLDITQSLHFDAAVYMRDADIDHTVLHFFVRVFSKTLVLHATADSTVESIIARISSVTGVISTDHRLIYRNRLLSEGSTLAECAIEKDTTLHLTCRLWSSRFPSSWQVLDEMLSAITDMLALGEPDGKGIPSIVSLVKKFLAMTPKMDDDAVGHFQVLISAKAHIAFVKLYLSQFKQIRAIGKEVIFLFFTWNSLYLSKPAFLQCTPILFEFCKLLAGTVSKMDSLYISCRSALGSLLVSQDRKFYLNGTRDMVTKLYPFVAELSEANFMFPSERSYLASDRVIDFSNFLKALRLAIRGWLGGEGSVPESMYKSPLDMCEEWATVLHAVFLKLLEKVDQGLDNVDQFMVLNTGAKIDSELVRWSNILPILRECHNFAKIYENAGQLLHAVLLARKVPLNALIKHVGRSEDQRWLLKFKDITDFETRKKLVMMLFPDRSSVFQEFHEMLIDRPQLLNESFEYIGQVEASALRGELFVVFKNEEATGPGVLREWFRLVCHAIFSPQHVLFLSCPNNPRRFFPNPGSGIDSLHLKYFSFVGRVIALALMHKIQIGITFDRAFFLQLSGKTITLEDIQDADPFLYMSCKKILSMDDEILDSDVLGLTFIREIEAHDSHRTVELCPGGMKIVVNSWNRKEYVSLLIQNCFVTSIAEQIHHFSQGFSDIFSETKLHKLFFRSLDVEDFNKLLGGSDDAINVNDWKAHTEYGGYKEKDCQISWFWKIVEGMQDDQKRRLLYFWTSLRHLPVEGFGGLSSKLLISRTLNSQNRLPTSQTCFYSLYLPQYSSISVMHDKIQLITQEHVSCSFGMS
ncbi:E3 ubiquitin-protein ligase UPL5 [Dendrobium catenatum]|uniref:HECT-type E3 ubiquitin transferase n=1 Tax=Dendrobium catenatum TaxID=906689 RepID=A0A2I0W1L5_9ASPA|nr:E3 ubiquitin-protein ligase UPL5 [Dendrobium catenatum]PKU69547.1 E3 ubiquitin-protein ligase UPL5 [Dendrobium catenatum]